MREKECALKVPAIGSDMPITDLIMELEQLRYKQQHGSTHPYHTFLERIWFIDANKR